jgi:signal transduction histidine kinase
MTRDGALLTVDPAQLVSMMFALLPVPVAITDERGRVVLCNSCFTDVFQGIPSVSTEPQYEMQVSGRGTFQVQTLPLTDQGYKIVYATDVTDQTQLRARMGRLEKMAAIGRAVTGVVNELEAPLADIASYALLIERSNLTPEARQMVGTVLTKAERAAHLVQSLTTLAGVAAARTTLFDLNRIVRNVVELRRRRHDVADYDVTLDLDANLPEILGDPSQIEQVVLTLLINAEDCVAAAPQSPGSIHVRTCVQGNRIQLHVSDTGFARDAARIFESGESGVGLNICAEIAKDHGGDLYAWSSYENGATLTLELPVSTPVCSPGAELLTNKTVMVVDDDAHVTEFVQEVLTRHGAVVEIARSGSEAYECFKTRPYDLVICDRHMPGLSGQGLYRLIQETDPETTRRFLFITEDPVAADTRQFFSEHGVQFLKKPFKVQELLDTIETLFSRNLLLDC